VKFSTVIHYSKGLLDCVHVDVWGPTKTLSLGGHRYFISFVDDPSRRCCLYSMRQRFDVLDLFMKWKKLMEKQIGKKIKVLQFDRVGEYKD